MEAGCPSRRVPGTVEERSPRPVVSTADHPPCARGLPLLPSLLSTEGCDNTALTHDPKGMWEMNEFVFVKRMGLWIKSSVKPRDIISIPDFFFFSFVLKGYSLSLSLSQEFLKLPLTQSFMYSCILLLNFFVSLQRGYCLKFLTVIFLFAYKPITKQMAFRQ